MNTASPLEDSAWRLLNETGVLDQLHQIGQCEVHGSLQLRTMAWPEIDIYVGVPQPTMEHVCRVLAGLTKCVAIRDMHIINQVNFPPRYATSGIMIIDVGIVWEETEWKLDVALQPSAWLQKAMCFNGKLLADMTEDMRHEIVSIKKLAVESPWYRRRNWAYIERGNYFYSNDIYRAVLDGKAKTYDEFRVLLKTERDIDLS